MKNGCVETATCLAHAGANVNKPDESSSRRCLGVLGLGFLQIFGARAQIARGFGFWGLGFRALGFSFSCWVQGETTETSSQKA